MADLDDQYFQDEFKKNIFQVLFHSVQMLLTNFENVHTLR